MCLSFWTDAKIKSGRERTKQEYRSRVDRERQKRRRSFCCTIYSIFTYIDMCDTVLTLNIHCNYKWCYYITRKIIRRGC